MEARVRGTAEGKFEVVDNAGNVLSEHDDVDAAVHARDEVDPKVVVEEATPGPKVGADSVEVEPKGKRTRR